MENINFFQKTENIDELNTFIRNLKKIEPYDEFEILRNDYIYQIINSIINNPSSWDKHCCQTK